MSLGLYYKLHGVHRPQTMKKSIIKRRKRVMAPVQSLPPHNVSGSAVAAPTNTVHQLNQNQALVEPNAGASDDDTESGENRQVIQSSNGSGAQTVVALSRAPRQYPIPTDFTLSFRTPSMSNSSMRQQLPPIRDSGYAAGSSIENGSPGNGIDTIHVASTRKRSHSISSGGDYAEDATSGSQRVHSISSILNPRNANDGNAPVINETPSSSSTMIVQTQPDDEDRISIIRSKRARLEMEQRRLNAELEACDRELSNLNHMESASEARETNDGAIESRRN